jgi:hypothetical protein
VEAERERQAESRAGELSLTMQDFMPYSAIMLKIRHVTRRVSMEKLNDEQSGTWDVTPCPD